MNFEQMQAVMDKFSGIIDFGELSEFQIEKFMKIIEDDFMNVYFELGYKEGWEDCYVEDVED